MSWVAFSLIASTLFSLSIIFDKFLLSKYFAKLSELSLTTAAALAGFPLLVVFMFQLGSFPSPKLLAVGFLAGCMMLGAFQIYYSVLKNNDPAMVTTLFQLILVFNLVFGIALFNERVKILEIAGLVLVAFGATLISMEQRKKKWKLNKQLLISMVMASMLASLSDVVFKWWGDAESYKELAFAEYASTVLAGLLILISRPKVRKELYQLKKTVLGTSIALQTNELLTLAGTLSIRYAIIIGPLALVQGIMGAQPLIVFIFSLVAGYLGLQKLAPAKRGRMVALEIVSILSVVSGAILIGTHTG